MIFIVIKIKLISRDTNKETKIQVITNFPQEFDELCG